MTSIEIKKKDIYKIVLVGDGGVGKTCLRNQYIHQRFTNRYKATIGADFTAKEVIKTNGRKVMLQIWDTAGQERFQSLGVAFYRGADACILVYDVNNYLTFENLNRWRNEFLKYCNSNDPDHFLFAVVGNKVDLDDRVVTKRQVKAWIDSIDPDGNRVFWFETSAKLGTNVESLFQTIVDHIPDVLPAEVNDNGTLNNLQSVASKQYFFTNSPYRFESDPYDRPSSLYSQSNVHLTPAQSRLRETQNNDAYSNSNSRCCFF